MNRIALFAAPIALATGLFLFAVPARLAPQAAAQEAKASYGGEVVDLACYLGKGAKGEAHKKCAQMCAAAGQPIGLLTTDGKLYLLVGSHDGSGLEQAKKLAGSNVQITGKMLQRDGMQAIEVDSVKEAK
jgi:hypothetical protein